MADVKQMRIFCAEQIEVPPTLPEILKDYSKAVIRNNPQDIIDFSKKYFDGLLEERNKNMKSSDVKLETVNKK